MLFTSLSFLLFLPVVFAVYWLLHRRLTWQNIWLVAASYVFYGWWDVRFLGLIILTSACSYLCALAIERAFDDGEERHAWLFSVTNIILNLAILGVFKYYDFFVESFARLLSMMGLHADVSTLHLILPVGISFYTFQALSYTIDVYRRRLPATRDIVAFFAYISFFPQLVAGPIERAMHLLPQMQQRRCFSRPTAVDGLRQMLWGFFKKIVVADTCALAVDSVWAAPEGQSSLMLLVVAILFAMQIYGDFSGYSDIAVGCARLFGIELMQNFRTPYFATSMADFWRRWHISLMTWLRDYLYIPLGGSRCSAFRQQVNIMLVFLASGLWHGAGWTFILWGLYHGVLLMTEKTFLLRLPVFPLVIVGWLIFRAPDLPTFGLYFHQFFAGLGNLSFSLPMGKTVILWSLLLLLCEWLTRSSCHPLQFPARGLFRHRAFRWAIYYLLIALIVFFHAESHTFIYFQF